MLYDLDDPDAAVLSGLALSGLALKYPDDVSLCIVHWLSPVIASRTLSSLLTVCDCVVNDWTDAAVAESHQIITKT